MKGGIMMKKIKSLVSALLCILLGFVVFSPAAVHAQTVSADPGFNKTVYLDFESGLGTSYAGRTPTGNNSNTAYVVNAEGGAGWSVAGGILNLQVTNGQWLRTWNSITGLEAYKYMVVRMRGTNSWGAGLTGNALAFKFGSAGSQTSTVYMSAEDLTADYSYVFIEVPNPSTFYSAVTATDYRYSLWIGTQRGAEFNVDIDEIFFTNDEPVEPEEAEESEESENTLFNPTVYSEFTSPLVTGTAADNGAGGTITLFALDGGTQTVSGGALNLTLNGEGAYIRFTSSVYLSRGTDSLYKYMIVRLKGGATKKTDNSPVTGNMINVVFASWGNQGNPAVISSSQINSDEYTDIVLELYDSYFANSHSDYLTGIILQNAGNYNTSVQIDRICFTDTLSSDGEYQLGDINRDNNISIADMVRLKKHISRGFNATMDDVDANGKAGGNDITLLKNTLLGYCNTVSNRFVYSDFSSELTPGAYVDSGEQGQKVQLMIAEDTSYSTENGILNATFNGAGGYLRFLNTVSLTGTARTADYKYMLITVKGNAYNSSGQRYTSGNLFKVWFGAWGSEAKAIYVGCDEVSGSLYSNVVIPLNDDLFAGIPDGYISGLFIKSAGASRTELSIDKISFYISDPGAKGSLSGSVTNYDFPGMTSSDYFTVTAGGENAFVYETNANNRRYSPAGNASDVMNYEKVGVVSFDLSGSTVIDVSVPDLTDVKVTPSSAEITPVISDGHARFTIPTCGQYTVEFNGSYNRALHIFANKPEVNPVSTSSGNVVYYGPGEYYAGEINLNSNRTLYLAGGAVVHGYVKASGKSNITIRGRGYLDGSNYSRYAVDGTTSAHKVPVDLYNCTNVTVEGISCLDPAGWAYNLNRCSAVIIRNIKVITSRQNGDGISVQSCNGVFVSGSFLRTWDDTLVVKNYDGYSTDNIHFHNCVLWTDLAQSMEIGYETVGDTMSRISFENITVLHNFHKAVVSVHNADHATVSDVTFKNIVVEDSTKGTGDGNDYLIELQVLYSGIWSREDTRGHIDGVTLKNIRALHGASPDIHITGHNADHRVDNVSLSGIYLPDRKITSPADSAFNTNSYASFVVS